VPISRSSRKFLTPSRFSTKVQDLRYGENPHQSAAFYKKVVKGKAGLADARQMQGKDLSFNNILDLNAALTIAAEFHEPAAVVIKHNNPCGAAVSKEGILEAYLRAYECDKTSAFAGSSDSTGRSRSRSRDPQ
jgi:phosphoribosylaminoimidazolecarboxamide formyltransferase/IMP cyclohydrolase